MKDRAQRLAMEVKEILGEIVTRQEIKDPRVQDAGLITLTHVRLTGDLSKATALFTVHGADPATLARVREGLNHAGGYLRRRLGRELKVRVVPTVEFVIDEVFDREARVDQLLRDIAGTAPAAQEANDDDPEDRADSEDEEGGR